MADRVKPIPDGYHPVTPYLCVPDPAKAIEFYSKAFGATELMRLTDPSGRVAHAEIKIGGAVVMLAGEFPEYGHVSPQTLGGTPVRIHLYVEDVDAVVNRAVAAGAKQPTPVANQFYGERSGRLEDPFGHLWLVSTHIEDVSPEEMQRRYAAMFEKK